ncbi:TraQ conjugal transfer family protein [Chryseobacterium sp. 22532]|uniref:TraQ conjugal transfer family protein n=1 Tax=Chryseobacterium sp. 22532 TaxID=3453938 RepID=UPI003F844E15
MNNVNKYKISNLVKHSFILFLMSVLFNSCQDNHLEIEQDFPFEVQVMPIPGKVKKNETVEIRISLETVSNFSDTKYSIRYFQFGGGGKLQHSDDKPYFPNDVYTLPQKTVQAVLYFSVI